MPTKSTKTINEISPTTSPTIKAKAKRRPTQRQYAVARELIENIQRDKPLNGGEIAEKVGYSQGIAETPSRVLEAEGTKIALSELGFDPESAKAVVKEIMLDPNQEAHARLKAADMTFKIHGSYAPEKVENTNKNIDATPKDDRYSRLKAQIEQELEKDLDEQIDAKNAQ